MCSKGGIIRGSSAPLAQKRTPRIWSLSYLGKSRRGIRPMLSFLNHQTKLCCRNTEVKNVSKHRERYPTRACTATAVHGVTQHGMHLLQLESIWNRVGNQLKLWEQRAAVTLIIGVVSCVPSHDFVTFLAYVGPLSSSAIFSLISSGMDIQRYQKRLLGPPIGNNPTSHPAS